VLLHPECHSGDLSTRVHADNVRRVRVLCLGEAIVDLICERRVSSAEEIDELVPHFGGAVANVAVVAAQRGADVALAGGAGADELGHWLRARLASAGVGLDWFELVEGIPTPVALVLTDPEGEPRFRVYGDGIAATLTAVAPVLEEAVGACDAVFLGSNTLVGEPERELSLRARRLALSQGKAFLYDPNLRINRWSSPHAAAETSVQLVPGSLLTRLNRAEAELLTGEPDPERAAQALLDRGARNVVVTLGAEGALLRGEVSAEASMAAQEIVSTVGAGDALMGVLVAALAHGELAPSALAEALPEAVAEGARAVARWGATTA
jgi:sugar/nucleoside kinase (ribokinase family)